MLVLVVVEDVSDLRRVTTVIVAYSRSLPSNIIMLTTQSSSISVDLMRVFLLLPVLLCWPDNIKTDISYKTHHVG